MNFPTPEWMCEVIRYRRLTLAELEVVLATPGQPLRVLKKDGGVQWVEDIAMFTPGQWKTATENGRVFIPYGAITVFSAELDDVGMPAAAVRFEVVMSANSKATAENTQSAENAQAPTSDAVAVAPAGTE
ncbi:MAG TPA: hypothetical protein PLB89_05290 [Flavobacteriales bacterium]|nr:hypothetical protein [Flavobacteriales bacterium]